MILDYLKEIDILVLKKMFSICKNNNDCYPSPVQGKILSYLYNNRDKEIYQKDLENLLHCSKVSLSEMLNKLETSGDIERVQGNLDKRKKRIILTEKSKIKLEVFTKYLIEVEELLLKDFSKKEKENLEYLLSKVRENLKEDKDV